VLKRIANGVKAKHATIRAESTAETLGSYSKDVASNAKPTSGKMLALIRLMGERRIRTRLALRRSSKENLNLTAITVLGSMASNV